MDDQLAAVLDESAQRELLALARATLTNYLNQGSVPEYKAEHPGLFRRCGAFVTLHVDGELRGCIGLLSSEGELYRTIQRCALSAAMEDTRFHPVTASELDRLTIEISVLSPLRRIQECSEIEVGRHGLIVSLGGLRGLLLPQVATRQNWDRETFLAQTCRKAGLPSNAWRRPNAAIQIFEAQVFSEESETDQE